MVNNVASASRMFLLASENWKRDKSLIRRFSFKFLKFQRNPRTVPGIIFHGIVIALLEQKSVSASRKDFKRNGLGYP